MKDLILITAFCPTKDKENKLKNLVTFFKNYSDVFDIMVTSHSNVSSDIIDICDYFIYDKENLLLYDDKFKMRFFFKTKNFIINTNYLNNYSTNYAVLKLTSIGLSLSKTLGYKKVHKIEYDTNITSVGEIIDNSNLLNEKDIIFYTKNGLNNNIMRGSVWSAKIDKLPNIYFSFIKKDVLDFISGDGVNLTIESLIQKEFLKKQFFCKDSEKLIDSGIQINLDNTLNRKNDNGYWCVPVYDKKHHNLKVFAHNNTEKESIEVLISYNNKLTNLKIGKNRWFLVFVGKIEEKSDLNIWVENDNKLKLNFESIDIELFKKYNYITYVEN